MYLLPLPIADNERQGRTEATQAPRANTAARVLPDRCRFGRHWLPEARLACVRASVGGVERDERGKHCDGAISFSMTFSEILLRNHRDVDEPIQAKVSLEVEFCLEVRALAPVLE